MDSLLQDIRYALRLCLRTPGFTIVAVLALAIGIGANTAIFTIVNAVLIERLPYRDPSRIVVVWESWSQRPGRPNTVGPGNYLRWRVRATAFEEMAGLVDTRINLTGVDNPEELVVQNVTEGFFSILGVPPLVGRTFSDDESVDPDADVTVLTYELWQRRFAGDPGIIGRAIRLNGRPVTVIGVMPAETRLVLKSGSLVGKPIDLWKPWVLPDDWWIPRGRFMSVIARLKPDVSVQAAQAQMSAIASGLTAEFPQFDTGWAVMVRPLREELSGDVRPALFVLAGAVAFVLLIACANVANLLLARGAARQRELAIRAALGAARARVMRQLLTESLVLGLAGGALGLLIAKWGLDLMLALSPVDLANANHIQLSYPVLAFTATVSIVTAIVCGFVPSFEASRADVQDAIKDGSRQVGAGARQRRLRQAFVVSEIALAVVLLVGAGLMLRSFATLRAVNPGFNSHDVLTMRVVLPGIKYDQPAKATRFFEAALQRIREIPGVRSAGAISFLPFAGLGAATGFTIVGRPDPRPGQEFVTDVRVCDNGYFQTMNVPLLRGRFFSDTEMQRQSNVVIISESLARLHFANEDPIGKQLNIAMTDPIVPTMIIGIVGDTKLVDLSTPTRPLTYWPHPQLAYNAMTFAVRTSSDPQSYASAVAREIRTLDRDQPVSDVRTMDQWLGRSLSQARFSSMLLAIFAAVALLLAAIGIYGVMAYAVTQQTSEIGIRLALGAEAGDILRMIVGGAAKLASFGLAAGVALALALNRTVSSLLYATTSTDPVTFAVVVVVLGGVALLASYLPARRASRITPVEALRYQ
jgi:putative ABC transport system permease protein